MFRVEKFNFMSMERIVAMARAKIMLQNVFENLITVICDEPYWRQFTATMNGPSSGRFHRLLDVFCNTLKEFQFGKFNLRQSNISSNSHQRFFSFCFMSRRPFFVFLMNLIRDAAKMIVFLWMQKINSREKLKLLWCYELLYTPISRLPQKIDLETIHSWARVLMNVNF